MIQTTDPQPAWLENQYAYDAVQPHAVTSVEREQAGGGMITDEFEYDANGNMTCRFEDGVVWEQMYNVENRLWQIKRMDGTSCSNMGGVIENWTFYYDGDGVRIKETHTDFETSPTTITTVRPTEFFWLILSAELRRFNGGYGVVSLGWVEDG